MKTPLTALCIGLMFLAGCSKPPADTENEDAGGQPASDTGGGTGTTAGPAANGQRDGPGGGGFRGRGGFDPAAMFADNDANGDGKLTADEMPERLAERIETLDTDGDGALTLEEFEAGRGRRGSGGGGFDPAARFAEADADGDGKLTGDEISERMRENLAEFDTDGDGSISQEEYMARMEQMRQGMGGGRGPGGGGGGGGGGQGGSDRPARPPAE